VICPILVLCRHLGRRTSDGAPRVSQAHWQLAHGEATPDRVYIATKLTVGSRHGTVLSSHKLRETMRRGYHGR
jgi:hypothetical protein